MTSEKLPCDGARFLLQKPWEEDWHNHTSVLRRVYKIISQVKKMKEKTYFGIFVTDPGEK